MVATACVDRALAPPSIASIDLGGGDGPVDLAGVDGRECAGAYSHQIVVVKDIQQLDYGSGLDNQGGVWFNVAARALVTFEVKDGCELPAELGTIPSIADDGSTLVWLLPAVWRNDSLPCGPPRAIERELTIPASMLSPQGVTFEDPLTSLKLFLGRRTEAPPACTPTQAFEPCTADCDCTAADPKSLCLIEFNGQGHCGTPCHEDQECFGRPGTQRCAGAPTWACDNTLACSSNDCPFGETFDPGVCICRAGLPPESGIACTCDAQCPNGQICGDQTCVQVCTGPNTCITPNGISGSDCVFGACTGLN